MIGLIASVVYSVCTNCVGVGYIEVICDKCDGKGYYLGPAKRTINRQNMDSFLNRPVMPCKGCSRGLVKSGQKGPGKIRKTCPTCKGQKKIKGS